MDLLMFWLMARATSSVQCASVWLKMTSRRRNNGSLEKSRLSLFEMLPRKFRADAKEHSDLKDEATRQKEKLVTKKTAAPATDSSPCKNATDTSD